MFFGIVKEGSYSLVGLMSTFQLIHQHNSQKLTGF